MLRPVCLGHVTESSSKACGAAVSESVRARRLRDAGLTGDDGEADHCSMCLCRVCL